MITNFEARRALLAERRRVEAWLCLARTVGDVWAINARLDAIDVELDGLRPAPHRNRAAS